jgi:seryl-tRNA synthetase
MLDLKHVSSNFDAVVHRLNARGGGLDLGPFQKLVSERRDLYVAMETLAHRRNVANEDMKKKAKEDPKAIEGLRGEMRAVSQEIKDKEVRLREMEEELEKILLHIPNIPH